MTACARTFAGGEEPIRQVRGGSPYPMGTYNRRIAVLCVVRALRCAAVLCALLDPRANTLWGYQGSANV